MITPRQAINANCKECIYDPHCEGTWKQQVENCTQTNCAFWELRPLTASTTKKIKAERYANMTPDEREKADRKAEAARKRFTNNT